MSSQQIPLRVKGWEMGMASSPHVGLGLIRNADIASFSGAVKVGKLPRQLFHKINTVTFTADAGTDVCTASGSIEANSGIISGAAVYFTTTGTLPAGLAINTIYYLYNNGNNTTFKVCASYKNSAGTTPGTVIDITDAGTGIHTMTQVPIGTANWIVEDSGTGNIYIMTSNGRVWQVSGSRAYLIENTAIEDPDGSLTNAAGQGLLITSFSSNTAYLFAFRNATIDVIALTTAAIEAKSWTNAWQSLNTAAGIGNSHHVIKAQDDAAYFCDGRYVGSIIENAGSTFDPANAATFTYNNQALDLPKDEIAQCLEELNTNLLIGGNTYNKIYPWDRRSASFDIPLVVPEYSIKRMKNIGNNVYILAGTWGNIYETQGSHVYFFKSLPFSVVNNAYAIQSNPITWGGIAEANGSLIFGVGGTTSGSSGVYRIYPNGALIHDNTPSTGSANVVGLFAKNEFYYMGYSGGTDNFSNGVQYSSGYATVLQSDLSRVSSKKAKATYSELEVQIAKPASSGSIRVSYRTNTESAFTTLATFAMDSTNTSFTTDIGLIDIENIQIQIEMHGNMEFLEAILYP